MCFRLFQYDGWWSKVGRSIAGMTFHYIDGNWELKTLPFYFLGAKGSGETADKQEDVIRAVITGKKKLAEMF